MCRRDRFIEEVIIKSPEHRVEGTAFSVLITTHSARALSPSILASLHARLWNICRRSENIPIFGRSPATIIRGLAPLISWIFQLHIHCRPGAWEVIYYSGKYSRLNMKIYSRHWSFKFGSKNRKREVGFTEIGSGSVSKRNCVVLCSVCSLPSCSTADYTTYTTLSLITVWQLVNHEYVCTATSAPDLGCVKSKAITQLQIVMALLCTITLFSHWGSDTVSIQLCSCSLVHSTVQYIQYSISFLTMEYCN